MQCFNSISESSSEMEGASSNPARVNTFELTSAVSDYHEKNFLFMYISEDDSET